MNSLNDAIKSEPYEKNSRAIGAIFVSSGRISADANERVLKLQREQGMRYGDAAVQLGLVTEDEVRLVLARQYRYAYLAPDDASISQKVVAAFRPYAPQVEQLRALRSQLMVRWFNAIQQPKTLAIVSPAEGEGKSFIAANLAVVCAQLGERTLLIDANLRNPQQHELFKLQNRIGLSSVLAGRENIADAVVSIAGISGLSLLPAGPIPPNPQELLGQSAFHKTIELMRNHYDIILLDTSAASLTSDVKAVAGCAGGVLAVAKENFTLTEELRDMVDFFNHMGVTVVGSLFNRY